MALDLGQKAVAALRSRWMITTVLGLAAARFVLRNARWKFVIGWALGIRWWIWVWCGMSARFSAMNARFSTLTCSPKRGTNDPAFINLQQPYFEKFIVEQIRVAQGNGAPIELRGKNAVLKVESHADYVTLEVDSPDGPYTIEADYLIACDGAASAGATRC